ncbi:Gfo/Idh/MocA family protein [Shewanella sp. KT0246]|uniref:Gfo/Idh/MocA family protein n=1 Tax=Shewanella sp. KT0246 TaxID=2815912 RepID=UPI001BC74E36|nr:Gfo/Idh/MocA family oxidoreductase [Shewanella sp. KT0246]GIU50756.1 NADH-dependent dehydrogenase [Shewanella sp. KT0246]
MFKKFFIGNDIEKLTKKIEELTSATESLTNTINRLEKNLPRSSESSKKLSPPKKASGLSIAVLGTRGHGQKHIAAFTKLKGCYISYICDVDSKQGKAAVEKIFELTGYRPKFVQDFREMLKDDTVDCVSIATPHHWHAKATILALQAGKHVYVEKPVTHTYSEKHAILAAAKKYEKIVQTGTQLRSNTSLAAAGQYMREGKLGDIEVVHCIVHKDRPPTPVVNVSKIPSTVDYDIWCGPAQKDEVTRSKFHYHWHWLWQFGNGALGNNGIHRIDAARIALDLKGYGDLVFSCGGRYGPSDAGETPNNMLTVHKFGKTWVLQDILGLAPKAFKGMENAVIFYGTKGKIVYKSGYAAICDDNYKEVERFEGKQLNHYYNFLEAVRAKDQKVARGPLEQGLLSGDLCHLGNISYRIGEMTDFASVKEELVNINAPQFVSQRLDALMENLIENQVKQEIVKGQTLYLSENDINPILENSSASKLLDGYHRKGFELPAPEDV